VLLSVDFWGAEINGKARKLTYGAGSVGIFDGHIVRCTSMSVTERVAHAILS
jgi:hypothetical protein